ncbi:DUF488 domain-containing protein [Dysgonomonas sp. 25]|uniref:DUF488 domain-containing protein n=1 Tax=Dysgonomonas sp. 25 TaxID=2302933 RepID=UPI0013D5911D|nr:DUF488 domain-containing protein [Dysgonomonas sp. 25]NDV69458.1 DUF488 domain-containing protein [Dysgonomonas sp. 25]
MTTIRLKRVYEDCEKSDRFRVLVDRLWPRGIKKEALKYDLWAKDITPSPQLRQWFHQNPDNNWDQFAFLYKKELSGSPAVKDFVAIVKQHPVVTLLYASKSPDHNHALILKGFIEKQLKG